MTLSVEEIPAAVEAAAERIGDLVRRTPAERSAWLSEVTGAEVFLKHENLQHTGSFKVRGALSRLLGAAASERSRGVVAASTGNHGAGVAWSVARVGARATIFVPESADGSKVAAIGRLGAAIERVPGDPLEAERRARAFAADSGRLYLSPYNDPLVVAGQGTLGLELSDQLPPCDAIFLALGGGGLLSGVAGWLASAWPGVEVVAASPENSKVMIESLAAGRVLDLPSAPTISDGTAGGVESDSITFELCRRLVGRTVTVSEAAIGESLVGFLDAHHELIEGSAAVALAALRADRERYAGRRVAVVLCGGNIGLDTLRRVLG